MRLAIDVTVPAEAHEDRDPEGFTAGLVLGLLRGAGLRVLVVEGGRHAQGSAHPVDTGEDSWGLGPQALVALAEAAAAFDDVTEAEVHRCPVVGCGYSHPRRLGVSAHIRGHELVECDGCGRPYKLSGIGVHRPHCPGRTLGIAADDDDVPDEPAPAPLVPDAPLPDPDTVPDVVDLPPPRPALTPAEREAREARLRAAAADAIGY